MAKGNLKSEVIFTTKSESTQRINFEVILADRESKKN